jgi:hypothetical protein
VPVVNQIRTYEWCSPPVARGIAIAIRTKCDKCRGQPNNCCIKDLFERSSGLGNEIVRSAANAFSLERSALQRTLK